MRQLVGVLRPMQLAEAYFGICKKGLEQLQVAIFHDLLQVAEHLAIDVNFGHLLTP
ncbi:hypothetical protein D3C84_1248110 [compost metagenome]